MGGLESVITGLMDEFNFRIGKYKIPRELFTICVLCASFSMSMVNVTRVSYFLHLLTISLWKYYNKLGKCEILLFGAHSTLNNCTFVLSGRRLYGHVVRHVCSRYQPPLLGPLWSSRSLLGVRIGPLCWWYPSDARFSTRPILEVLLEVCLANLSRRMYSEAERFSLWLRNQPNEDPG